MKLAILLTFLLSINVSASVFSQNTKLDLNINNLAVRDVLKIVEGKTSYRFFYSDDFNALNKTISCDLHQASLETILLNVLRNTQATYTRLENNVIVISPFSAQPQNELTGTVTDAVTNEPIAGAIVSVEGTTIGVQTDINGHFSLYLPKANAVIKVTFMGYLPEKISLKGQTKIDVKLTSDIKRLDEVVVVGYGTVRKSDLTGSIASVSSKTFLDQPTSSANSVLSGRAPGVTVRRTNGAPGEGSTIRIRGANSLYGGNDPLIVVDGNYNSSMPDANDIESIEILKDASATAIYGSRGANGVILVKTKRGKEGKPTLQFYSNVSLDKTPQVYDLMNAYEFAEFNNRVGTYSFTDDELAKYKANGGTDWQKEIMQTGISQNYKVILSGGLKNVKYYISPIYRKSTGTIRNTEAEGYGISSKVDMDLSNKISVQIETNLAHSNNLNPSLATGGSKTSIPLMAAMVWAPTEPIYDPDGGYNRLGIGTGAIINPLLMTTLEDTKYTNSGSGIGNIKVDIIKGLVLEAKGSISFDTGGDRNFESTEYTGVNATASQSSYETKTWLVNGFLTYTKTLAELHNFSLMGGFEETQGKTRDLSGEANALPLESVGWDNLGLSAPNVSVGSSYSNNALRSYFGRMNYNYASRYFLTVNYRADGSSKFKGSNQWGYFPSFSLAWKLSEEGFMKNQNIFQNAKIRGGWGIIGNQAIGNYATYTTLASRGWSWGTSTQYSGYYARVGGNANLKWESTKQMNLGIDLTTLNNRLNIALDYYNKKTVDLLAPVSVAAYNGGDSEYGKSTVISNVGSVRNKGFEFNINYNILHTKNLSYDINLNGAINKNKVLSLGGSSIIYGDTYAAGLTSVSPFALIPGQPIGTIYGLKYLGIWQENEATEAAKFGQVPGDYKYEDLNGNHSYDTNDKQVIGHSNPDFTWGFNNHFSYKNFDLNILVEGVHGRDVMNWSYMVGAERGTVATFYTLKAARNRWTPANPDAEFARVGNTNNMQPLSSQYMQNGDYVKLRNVSLSYRIPKSVISFASLKLSVSAQNILTITKYKGYDPEISSSTGNDINAGMDWFAYPNPKSFSFGIALEY